MSFFKIGVDRNCMSASEYLPLYQSFTNRTYIRNGRWFDHSEISQIVEKNVCCGVILSGLIQLKSIPRTEYIVLPYNTRAPTLWTPFDGGNLGCQKWTIQDNAYTTSNKLFGIQKLTPQVECRWTVIKMITVGKAQRTKWLPKSIFYRWYDQWTLSKSVKVQ